MSTVIYKPYTYLIGWSTHKIWYYGARFAKGCNPIDLWNPYKTSSKYVTQFIQLYGDPDIIQVRKTFQTGPEAQLWEERVLRKIDVVRRHDFLNKTHTNRIKSEAISNGLKKYWDKLTPEERTVRNRKAVQAMLASSNNVSPAERSIWVKRYWDGLTGKEKTEVNKKSREGSIKYYEGLSQDEKTKRARNAVNSVAIVECPHCKLTGRRGNMNRWHFDNCKLLNSL